MVETAEVMILGSLGALAAGALFAWLLFRQMKKAGYV